ncbi:LOW QUALITY PROTEIN: hypothetical protein MAR_023597 [Mya arenaria]|uniref:Uncharacterized protein n=1 Tax=Mya arenaria TaxID=6604 RepID=A0ABY7DNE4_MYAAR|nr:LOW QUALITY PROTEIN: hypothetical protein MAR_023597 [Mya arenaria]
METYGTFDPSELFMFDTETETRIPPAGRDSARNTPCQTRESSSDAQEGDQKEGSTRVEHLNVYQSFKESDLYENLPSLDSDDMFDPPITTGQGRIFFSQNQYMTNAEFQALCSCKEEIILQIDPLFVSSTLRRKYPRFENVYQIIHYLKPSDREIVSKMLIRHLPQKICFLDFVVVLGECGYKKLAEKLYLSLFKQNTAREPYITYIDIKSKAISNEMIDDWKMMVDDAQFTNSRLKLCELRDKFILQMNNERNVDQRQFLADKCVAIIVAEIDAFAITFDKGLYKGHLFTKMNSLISKTSNSLLTYVVYFGRLAHAYAIAGRLDESEKIIEAARCKAVHICFCRELPFMFYIEVQVKLHSFERTPTVDERWALLIWGTLGIECAEQDGKKTRRRSFV